MKTEPIMMFPGVYPISRCERKVQVGAKAILARAGLLDAVWPTRDRIEHIFYNTLPQRIWVRQTNRHYPVMDLKKAVVHLEKHGWDASDCRPLAGLLEAPHYRAVMIDIRSPTVWRRRVQHNRPPLAGDTRVMVHVEPTRPIAPQLASFMAPLE